MDWPRPRRETRSNEASRRLRRSRRSTKSTSTTTATSAASIELPTRDGRPGHPAKQTETSIPSHPIPRTQYTTCINLRRERSPIRRLLFPILAIPCRPVQLADTTGPFSGLYRFLAGSQTFSGTASSSLYLLVPCPCFLKRWRGGFMRGRGREGGKEEGGEEGKVCWMFCYGFLYACVFVCVCVCVRVRRGRNKDRIV
ncbi:hypothetical protein BJ546DRAFT_313491 [Cryomyces antarcticus]